LGKKIDHSAGILLEVGRVVIDGGFQSRSRHAAPSSKTLLSIQESRRSQERHSGRKGEKCKNERKRALL